MTKLRFCVIFTIILVSFKVQSRPCINVVNYAHEDSVIKIIIYPCDPQHLHHPRLKRQTFLGDNNTPIIKYDPDNEVCLKHIRKSKKKLILLYIKQGFPLPFDPKKSNFRFCFSVPLLCQMCYICFVKIKKNKN